MDDIQRNFYFVSDGLIGVIFAMLQLSKTTMGNLAQIEKRKFSFELKQRLASRNPELLARFPDLIQQQIVENMIDRALVFGATWQSSIAKICLLMETFAPNFLSDPKIRKLLQGKRPGTPASDDLDELLENFEIWMDEEDWERIIKARSDLPLYTSYRLDEAPYQERIASALCLVFWDKVKPETAHNHAAHFINEASRFGLASFEDAPLAIAGWGLLYKPEDDPSWQQDLSDPIWSASERLEMLRYRIMLDHGRRV